MNKSIIALMVCAASFNAFAESDTPSPLVKAHVPAKNESSQKYLYLFDHAGNYDTKIRYDFTEASFGLNGDAMDTTIKVQRLLTEDLFAAVELGYSYYEEGDHAVDDLYGVVTKIGYRYPASPRSDLLFTAHLGYGQKDDCYYGVESTNKSVLVGVETSYHFAYTDNIQSSLGFTVANAHDDIDVFVSADIDYRVHRRWGVGAYVSTGSILGHDEVVGGLKARFLFER